MKKKSLLDSYALLGYLKKESSHQKVRNILASDKTSVLMNDINVGETYYILAKERSQEAAKYFLSTILPSLPIKVLSNTFAEVIEAAEIKAQYTISFADAFATATAIRMDAELLTGDPEFRRVEQLVKIRWL